MDWIYLDNNATTQPAAEVAEAMDQVNRTWWANPSSVHRFGQAVRQRLELARASMATLIGARPRELIFTSGGTESDNLALGALRSHGDGELITTAIEHSAVREPATAIQQAGGRVTWLGVDRDGRADLEQLRQHLDAAAADGRPTLVSVQWANNETGVIQPIDQVAALVADARRRATAGGRRTTMLLHVDATQAVGKIPVDVKAAGVDLLTAAGHKFHGPKGSGVLYVRSGVRLQPMLRGGPQEREKRGGTENTAAVVGLGVAAELAQAFVADASAIDRLRALRDRFERAIVEASPGARVNSAGAQRLWNTSNLAFPGLEAEAILLGLSERGVCASAGAACSSGSLEPSPVLRAMGLDEPTAHGSVRFSLSRFTTEHEIDQAIDILPRVVARLQRTMPVG